MTQSADETRRDKEHDISPANGLDTDRQQRLAKLERIVEEGLEVFVRVGEALDEIRRRELYAPDHDTFDDYCQARFGWSRRHGDRLVRAARTHAKLRPIGLDVRNEAQAREMSRVADDPGTAKRVWEQVGEQNDGKHPAKALRNAIDAEYNLVQLPDSLVAGEGQEVLDKYAAVKQGEHGGPVTPSIMQQATKNRGKRIVNEIKRKLRVSKLVPRTDSGIEDIQIHLGEFQKLADLVEDHSVDLILTDPPYAEELLWLFDDLGEIAARVLKPDGSSGCVQPELPSDTCGAADTP